jgi:hypothetical protein
VISEDQLAILKLFMNYGGDQISWNVLPKLLEVFHCKDGRELAFKMLEDSLSGKHSRDFDRSISLAQYFLDEDEITKIELSVLYEDWHKLHEDIVFGMSLNTKPEYAPLYLRMIKWTPTYLLGDEFRVLAVKAIWGLGKTPTFEAEAILRELAKSPEEVISRNAKEQLIRRGNEVPPSE